MPTITINNNQAGFEDPTEGYKPNINPSTLQANNNIKLNNHPWAASPKLLIRIPGNIKATTNNMDDTVDTKTVGGVKGGVVEDDAEAEDVGSNANNASDDNITDDDMPYGFKDFFSSCVTAVVGTWEIV